MKLDELERLLDGMDLRDILLKPADVTINAGLMRRFPAPNCEDCKGRCCPPRLDLKLSDIARLIDNGLDKFIEGTFESFFEHSLSLLDGGDGVEAPFPRITPAAESTYCRFLDGNHRCGIYEARMSPCRAFPLAVVQNEYESPSLQWFGDQCKIVSDENSFWRLVDNAVLNWNEGVKNQLLLMNARDELRELGFGKYLGDERKYKLDRNRQGD